MRYLKTYEGYRLSEKEEALNEGWKEIFLSAMITLAGIGGASAQKMRDAEKILNHYKDDPNKAKAAIEFVENDRAVDSLLVTMGVPAKDIKKVHDKIEANARNLKSKVDQAQEIEGGGEKILQNITLTVSDAGGLEKALGQWYAVQSFDVTFDTLRGEPIVHFDVETEEVQDTVYSEIMFGKEMKLFPSGAYYLGDDIQKGLQDSLNKLRSQGWEFIGVEMEASTDCEKMDWDKDETRKADAKAAGWNPQTDPTGNITLAKKRIEVLKQFFESNKVKIDLINELPNQGSVTFEEFEAAKKRPSGNRQQLSDDMQPFRYTKVKIKVQKIVKKQIQKPTEVIEYPQEIVKKVIVNMIRVVEQDLVIQKEKKIKIRQGKAIFQKAKGCVGQNF